MSETTATSDISIKQLGQITWLSDYSAYNTYFLASIAQGDNWSTKNVSYVNLSNDLYAVISVKVPNTETINALTNDVSYLGSLSNNWRDAANFANTYVSISNFLSGFNINTQWLSTHINNGITSLNDAIAAVDNNVTTLEDGTVTQLCNLITSGDICVDISTLNISVDNIADGIAGLDIDTIVTLAENVKNISVDLYHNPVPGEENYIIGDDHTVIRRIDDLSDWIEGIVKFIDENILTGYVENDQTLGNYISNYITTNYTLVDKTIAKKLNEDNELKNAASLRAYIQSIIEEE